MDADEWLRKVAEAEEPYLPKVRASEFLGNVELGRPRVQASPKARDIHYDVQATLS